MGRRRRRRVVPADDWEQLELLCVGEEQKEPVGREEHEWTDE